MKVLKTLAFIVFLIAVGFITFIIADKYIEVGDTQKTQNLSAMTEQEALSIGQGLYEKAVDCYMMNIKREEGSADYLRITNQEDINDIKLILTDNAFKKYTEYYGIEDRNGVYYIANAGKGSDQTYVGNDRLTMNKIEDERITFTVTVDYSDDSLAGTEQTKTEDYEFIVVKEDGKWKVESFTMPY